MDFNKNPYKKIIPKIKSRNHIDNLVSPSKRFNLKIKKVFINYKSNRNNNVMNLKNIVATRRILKNFSLDFNKKNNNINGMSYNSSRNGGIKINNEEKNNFPKIINCNKNYKDYYISKIIKEFNSRNIEPKKELINGNNNTTSRKLLLRYKTLKLQDTKDILFNKTSSIQLGPLKFLPPRKKKNSIKINKILFDVNSNKRYENKLIPLNEKKLK